MTIEVESSLLKRGQGGGLRLLRWYHKQVKELWQDSINAFIFEVMFSMKGPDTGMSRGSLLPLAGEVHVRQQAAAVARGTNSKGSKAKGRPVGVAFGFRGAFDPQGNWHPNLIRNVALGAKYGRDAYKVDYGSHTNANFGFEFNLTVWQSKIWEPEVGALEAGGRAFKDYFNNNFERYVPEQAFRHFIETGRAPSTYIPFL